MEKNIRSALPGDADALARLMQGKPFLHRHLAWNSPLELLGQQPYLVQERGREITAALACPPDEEGITWLQLFAVAPGNSVYQAWNELWPPAKAWLEESSPGDSVSCLAIQQAFRSHLKRSDFRKVNEVVVLLWNVSRAVWPGKVIPHVVREMEKANFARIAEIDRQAFSLIWRNGPEQLEAACRIASSATVIEIDGRPAGYQISTVNPQGGHLARLAVEPVYQNLGVGTALLADLLNRFLDKGIVDVSVNTQADNFPSLDLYRKFGFMLVDERYPVYQCDLRSPIN